MATEAVTLLTEDHRTVEALFARYESTPDTEARTEVVHRVVHDLAVHGEIEELLFYPAVRRAVADGSRLVEEAVHEHVQIKETLNALDRLAADDPECDVRMRELMQEVRHHVQEEESTIFPGIRAAMDERQLTDLGRALEGAKAVVPTRPHPRAPTIRSARRSPARVWRWSIGCATRSARTGRRARPGPGRRPRDRHRLQRR